MEKIILSGNREEVEKQILDIYTTDCEVCVGELMAQVYCPDLTMEEVFDLYIKIMNQIEDDNFIQVNEAEGTYKRLI